MHATLVGEEETAVPIFSITKALRFGCCCLGAHSVCGRDMMTVHMGGVVIGSVEEECVCGATVRFSVYDESENLVYLVERNSCQCSCKRIPFDILLADGTETNCVIEKVWAGMMKEMFTTDDNFLCQFPPKSSLKQKLLLIAAAMMLEYRYVLPVFMRCIWI